MREKKIEFVQNKIWKSLCVESLVILFLHVFPYLLDICRFSISSNNIYVMHKAMYFYEKNLISFRNSSFTLVFISTCFVMVTMWTTSLSCIILFRLVDNLSTVKQSFLSSRGHLIRLTEFLLEVGKLSNGKQSFITAFTFYRNTQWKQCKTSGVKQE